MPLWEPREPKMKQKRESAKIMEMNIDLERAVPGVSEAIRLIDAAVDARQARQLCAVGAAEDGPSEDAQRIVAHLQQYPRAAVYIRARIESATTAMEILAAGGSIDDAERAIRERQKHIAS